MAKRLLTKQRGRCFKKSRYYCLQINRTAISFIGKGEILGKTMWKIKEKDELSIKRAALNYYNFVHIENDM